ncbi:hypothetical protein PISL3812_08384 [Talaromyces islandicus]|uniref:Zn(2)-C6 fungal-type domain-containing protein n=1 Tax=Talaromyces islandicus TaxID=28573 RepID=A0A0U1M8U5_TALIS|nr:hypothetical protein PISL3812_08384 [Talaromyces islandicus]
MVGVNRSKACITCIRRKKGCDQQKPTCGQCRKSCIECKGYDRPRTFVNSFVQEDAKNAGDPGQTNLEVAFSRNLMRSARETSVLGLFWNSYFPNGKKLPQGGTITILGGLMHLVQEIYTADDLLRKTIVALSLSAIGMQEDPSGWMREKGRRLYGDALQGAVTLLQNPRRRQENGLLIVIRLFSLYEVMSALELIGDSDEQSLTWMTHCFGDAAIIQDRGPLAFVSGAAHRLFVDGRLHLIMTSLRTRKKCFLSDPAWKKLPWNEIKKSPKDLLLDILVDVPTLFEAIDIMSHCKDAIQKADYLECLYLEYVSLEKRLRMWHRKFSPVLIILERNIIVQDVVVPQILAAGHVSTLYWATCIIVYGIVAISLMAEGYGEECFRGKYINPAIFCQNILRIIPLFLHYSTGIFRVHLATPPLSIAMIYLCSLHPEEMKEEKAMLSGYLQDPLCSTMRKFLASMNPQEATEL